MNDEWTQEWPTEPGHYWFYSYRYGKMFGIDKNKPELLLMEVFKIANGIMHTAEGQCVYKYEPKEAWFMKVELPETPKLSD